MLDEIVRRAPSNLAALIERARIAARRRDEPRLATLAASVHPAVRIVDAAGARAVQVVRERRRRAAIRRCGSGDDVSAQRSGPGAGVSREPDGRAHADRADRRTLRSISRVDAAARAAVTGGPVDYVMLRKPRAATPRRRCSRCFRRSKPPRSLCRRRDKSSRGWTDQAPRGRFRRVAAGSGPPSASSLVALDWNHDFRTDIVMAGRGGVRAAVTGSRRAASSTRPTRLRPEQRRLGRCVRRLGCGHRDGR